MVGYLNQAFNNVVRAESFAQNRGHEHEVKPPQVWCHRTLLYWQDVFWLWLQRRFHQVLVSLLREHITSSQVMYLSVNCPEKITNIIKWSYSLYTHTHTSGRYFLGNKNLYHSACMSCVIVNKIIIKKCKWSNTKTKCSIIHANVLQQNNSNGKHIK